MKKTAAAVILASAIALTGTAETLSVATINVWSGLTYEGIFRMGEYEAFEARTFRYGLLVNELDGIDPDVIGLNEANMLPGYARRISRDLGYAFTYHVGLGGVRLGSFGLPVNLREGDVILAREEYGLEPLGYRRLSGGYADNFASFHFGDATQVISAKIRVGKRDVYLFCTHWHASEFASTENLRRLVEGYASGTTEGRTLVEAVTDAVKGAERRMSEAEALLEYIDSVAGDNPVILMGDFNALPSSPEIGVLEDAGFRDCWEKNRDPGYTWDEVRNANIVKYQLDGVPDAARRRDRIDYIFVRGDGIRPVSAELILDKATYDIHPSDHFGVLAVVEIAD